MPKVSVVIPVYNVDRFLAQCLDSVVAQTLSDIEIICVNDGSTDRSSSILNEYAQRDTRIVIVDQANQGLAGARNTGLDAATGQYVLFLDSDDWAEVTMIEEAYTRCAEDDAEIGIFKVRYVYTDTGVSVDGHWTLQLGLIPENVPFSRDEMVGNIFRFVTPCVWNKMFKRSFILDGRLRFVRGLLRAEDIPFTWVALANAMRITVLDRVLVNYRKGVSDSLQSTIHEKPIEICRALALAKEGLVRAGVFTQLERDFTNAALYQCLFTLESLTTAGAFRELYNALTDRYFAELGISGRDQEYFVDDRNYEQYVRITNVSADQFLFDEIRTLRSDLIEMRAKLSQTRSSTSKAGASLKKIQKSHSYLLGQRVAGIVRRAPHSAPLDGKGK